MRYLYILFLFALLAACEHEPLLSEAGVPVRIVPSLDDAAPGDTRVVDQTWTANDPVGVSISSDATTFKEYKASAGTSVTLTPKDAANTLYYPVNGNEVTFRAFCPYKAPVSNVVTYNTFTDQGTSAKMQAVDLVYHSGATGSKSTAATPVNMSFQHKFSKVVITATRGAGVTDNLTNLAMTLTGMPTSAAFNVSTGALGTVTGTGAITPEHYSKAAATTSAHAIIAPHAGKTGRTITFAVGSLNYSYAIPDGLAFETGKTYAFNFTLTQTAPVLSGTIITNWNSGTIAWDGTGNSLTAPTEVIHYKETSTGNTIVIKTNHTATPGIQFSTSATSVTGSLSWLTQTGYVRTKATSPYEHTLTYSVAATSADRAGYIHISVGGMTVVTKVTQSKESYPAPYVDGETNCFMVHPGTAIKFPLSRPISQGTATSSATFTVEKLWDDATGGAVSSISVSGTGSNALVTVVAGNNPGNALVAAKVNNIIVWSYHIWVTEHNPHATTYTNTYNTNNNGKSFVFMDRNLGATFAGTGSGTGTGLFYQWGRKDPFPATLDPGATQPGSGSFTISAEVTASTGTIDYAIKNPHVFLKAGSASSNDWYYGGGSGSAGRNHELWGHSGNKTVYDPCPAGWRVPKYVAVAGSTSSPWYGFTRLNGGSFSEGFTWGTNAAYPAAGARFFSSEGVVLGAGTDAFYWGASGSGGYGLSLVFGGSGPVYQTFSYPKSNGFSIRCVQDTPEITAPYVDGNANCFVVAPRNAIKFLLTRPVSQGTSTDYDHFTLEKLWDDTAGGAVSSVSVSGGGSNAVATVVAGSNPGNALIAVKVGTTIVWSYHIWVTDYNLYATWDPKQNGGTTTNSNVVFMDRNLGATANTLSVAGRGLFYQWGRKDPMPRTDISGFSKAQGPVDDATARQNPDKFYYYNVTSSDWLSIRDDSRWGGSSGVKTVHDPCPSGWRVPRTGAGNNSPWAGLASQTFTSGASGGFTWGTNGAYPAAGFRNYATGNLDNVGVHGRYWGATSAGTGAYNLYFLSGGINTSSLSSRTEGYPVRCVKE